MVQRPNVNQPETQLQISGSPLNPLLYRRLCQRFGKVYVANPGMAMIPAPTPLIGGRRSKPISSGEYYRVCCPYCGDTRYRLWINHRFGAEDENGKPMGWWIVCYNEGCFEHWERRVQFMETIYGLTNRNVRPLIRILPGVTALTALEPVTMPGDIIRIDALESDHPAAAYLLSRGFDLSELATRFEIGFCEQAAAPHYAMAGRITIPIYMDGQLVGWQGRYPSDNVPAGTAKYYGMRGMAKRLMLYNFDAAKPADVVVIVEGVTGVWRLQQAGISAIALLGKKLNPLQMNRILQVWAHKPIGLFLDADANEVKEGKPAPSDAEQIMAQFRMAGHQRVFNIVPPAGYDSGSMPPGDVSQLLLASAAAQNVILDGQAGTI